MSPPNTSKCLSKEYRSWRSIFRRLLYYYNISISSSMPRRIPDKFSCVRDGVPFAINNIVSDGNWCSTCRYFTEAVDSIYRVNSRLAPSQREASLQCNVVSHWLGANLESALHISGFPSLGELQYMHWIHCIMSGWSHLADKHSVQLLMIPMPIDFISANLLTMYWRFLL